VAALFRVDAPAADVAAWAEYFRKSGGKPLAAVDQDGLLKIPWPQRVDGNPLECDVLLATTNVETPAVTPEKIAEAWIAQDDGEYFFANVQAGVRTPDDERIWRRLAGAAAWLNSQVARHGATILQLQQEYPGT
jgi:hypothetical protein